MAARPTHPAAGMHEHETGNPATDFSIALLTEFVRLGVREILLSPGSRSQALALVAAELERAGAARLHVRIDERTAGFVALGVALETRIPALVITTSGTAPANLYPAVLEAHHSGVPMIVLTADRPDELRGIRANQTTTQPGMFANSVRMSEDISAPVGAAGEAECARSLARAAFAAATGSRTLDPGPVQLNLAFREPLSAVVPELAVPEFAEPELADPVLAVPAIAEAPTLTNSDRAPAAPPFAVLRDSFVVRSDQRTIVVAGADSGEIAESIARAGGWPLIAEISSGARFGPNLVVAYRELLPDPDFGGLVERAIVFGHPTLSRELPALLNRADVEVIVVAPQGTEVYQPGRRAAQVVSSVEVSAELDPRTVEARSWVGRWVFTSRQIVDGFATSDSDAQPTQPEISAQLDKAERLAIARAELALVRAPVTRRMLVDSIWKFTWPHDRLLFGASRLIRVADSVLPGKKIRVYSNRGLAGIDGTISTGIGVALASRRVAEEEDVASGITRVLLGDLTLLHDVGALLLAEGEITPHIQVVVGNDGGGTIFDSLEVAQSAPIEAMRRVMLTPQRVDFAALATAYGWQYVRASTRGQLEDALSAPPIGPSLLEVPLAR
jgi:2-succinyl-5-enolpyruvyl-6-hydroxy-3-cyclohexene-1-carboxylate synthase